jgi:hypothetical protein
MNAHTVVLPQEREGRSYRERALKAIKRTVEEMSLMKRDPSRSRSIIAPVGCRASQSHLAGYGPAGEVDEAAGRQGRAERSQVLDKAAERHHDIVHISRSERAAQAGCVQDCHFPISAHCGCRERSPAGW